MALPIPPVYYSAQEYLDFESEADYKSEYLNGKIYAMAGASPRHSTITVNITREISTQLMATNCRAFSNDTKVRTPADELFCYPDLSVVCGDPVFVGKLGDVLDNPVMIIEITSPSTSKIDHVEKFARYREIRSLTDYVMIAQNQPRVEHYVRQPDNTWLLRTVSGLDSQIDLVSIGCKLTLVGLYHLVEFDGFKPTAV